MKYYTLKKLDNASTFITITLSNFRMVLSSYGASIYSIETPDKDGVLEYITLTLKEDDFFNNKKYCGLTVGPVGGRIPSASFIIDNKNYCVPPNENGNLLHSGFKTWAWQIFDYKIKETAKSIKITFFKLFKESDDDFPGNKKIEIIYEIFKDGRGFDLIFNCLSDENTLFNVINHSYYNLSGNLKRNLDNQILTFNCKNTLVLDDKLIPSRKIKCEGKYDFSSPESFMERYKDIPGFDDVFLGDTGLKLLLKDPISYRNMSIESSYYDVVIYTNQYVEEVSFLQRKDTLHLGVAIEPTNYGRILHKDTFLSRSNEKYIQCTKYRFFVEA